MKKESNTYVLTLVDIKILDTVSLLNVKKIFPTQEGVYLILKGSEDPDIVCYKEFPTYKTLVSYSQKKISRLIMMLLRYKYLENLYDMDTDSFYLKVTDKALSALFEYHRKHRYRFAKKKVKDRHLFLFK